MNKRRSLYAATALILVYWSILVARQLWLRPVPTDVGALLLRKCIEAAVLLLVAWVFLRWDGEPLSALGFRIDGPRQVLVYGVLVPICLFVLLNVVLSTLLSALLGTGGTNAALRALFRDPHEAPLWILTAIIGGGFAEELERAFALTRFERLFGRPGVVAGLLINGVVFGLRHSYQGSAGAIGAGLSGIVLGLVFLRRHRCADAMLAHAGYDLLGIAAAYALYGRS